jgi:nucleoside-diphosphate-sugar epimerase
VVIDMWPDDPALAESCARLLKERTKHYLYVSSIAAYKTDDTAALFKPNLTEDAPLADWNGPAHCCNRGKAESERRLRALIGERLIIVRPGPSKGVRSQSSELFTWVPAIQNGQSVIAAGDGSEMVDAKDVAAFLVLAIDRST